MNETTKKIKELREEVERLNSEIMKLERENSKFYIGVCYDGDDNYRDEYYHRLGYITEEEAKAWANEQLNKEDVYKARYFEITSLSDEIQAMLCCCQRMHIHKELQAFWSFE